MTQVKDNEANKIYVYTSRLYPGLVKIGQTVGSVEKRVSSQFACHPIIPGEEPLWKVEYWTPSNGYTDRDIHKYLRLIGEENVSGEWFKLDPNDAKHYIEGIVSGDIDINSIPMSTEEYLKTEVYAENKAYRYFMQQYNTKMSECTLFARSDIDVEKYLSAQLFQIMEYTPIVVFYSCFGEEGFTKDGVNVFLHKVGTNCRCNSFALAILEQVYNTVHNCMENVQREIISGDPWFIGDCSNIDLEGISKIVMNEIELLYSREREWFTMGTL